MFSSNKCHAEFIPRNKSELIMLIRSGSIIYKFTIKNGDALQRIIKQLDEISIQQKIQNLLLYVISMKEEGPAEVYLSTSSFVAKIDVHSWHLSSQICFKSIDDDKTYYASEMQYTVTVTNESSTTKETSECNDKEPYPSKKFPLHNEDCSVTDSALASSLLHADMKTKEIYDEEKSGKEKIDLKRAYDATNSAGGQKDIGDKTSKAEDERLIDLLNTKNLNPSTLSNKHTEKSEGFFTRVFGLMIKNSRSTRK